MEISFSYFFYIFTILCYNKSQKEKEVCDMNYIDVLNFLKDNNYTSSTYSNTQWYPDDIAVQKYIDDNIRSIWYSDGKNEIEVKEERKNGKIECSHPDDGCIYR